MRLTHRTILAATGVLVVLSHPLAASAQELPRNVRLVIGSDSSGGDTYQASSMIADALSEKLGVNVKVDAVGATNALNALQRDARGNTLKATRSTPHSRRSSPRVSSRNGRRRRSSSRTSAHRRNATEQGAA